MVTVHLSNGQKLTSDTWTSYSVGEQGLNVYTDARTAASFAPGSWRYVYADTAPEIINPAPYPLPQPF